VDWCDLVTDGTSVILDADKGSVTLRPSPRQPQRFQYKVCHRAKGHRVTLTLQDIGADKPLAFLCFLAESTPASGRRRIRLLQEPNPNPAPIVLLWVEQISFAIHSGF
jgi:phosphoenolpyruvate-protein kinase (PTS system EI component)